MVKIVLTSKDHLEVETDMVGLEAVNTVDYEFDVVNIQGDEPCISPEQIDLIPQLF